mgnify:CR=1 FL=1
MRVTNLGETIIEYSDIIPQDYDQLAFKLLKCGTYRGKHRTYVADYITMDIETSTTGRLTAQPVAFTYSIAVYIAGECYLFRTWEQYLEFIHNLGLSLGLSKYLRLVCYVHNLPYEFQFMRNFMHITEVFATSKRKVVKCLSSGIEYRCSYKLTNMSLDKFTKNTPEVTHGKLSGSDFDYSKLRTPTTYLTDTELDYIYNDVAGLYEALSYMISHDKYNIANIPLTSTGYVRNDLRQEMASNPENRKNFLQCRLDQYLYGLLRTARRGGNTHCNPIYSCMDLPDLTSKDMSSAYPAVMVQCKFPMTKFLPIRRSAAFEDYVDTYACIIDITFNNICVDNLSSIAYIPKAHCTQLRNVIGDNGRVLSADKISMVLTDIDYKIIRDTYHWESMECRCCYVAEYGYLPMELRLSILKQYKDKTTLKDKDPYLYMKKKNKFNANFGCMLTDICQDSVQYHENSEEPFTLEKTDEYSAQLDAYYASHRNFLQYQHGVWVTAQCRARLQKAIMALGDEMVYCDTDSAKFFDTAANRKIFDKLNAEIREEIKECGLNCTVEYKGKEYTLGLWDSDGDYKLFKSMGAKKYCYIDGNDDFEITVAGLSKSKAKDWLLEHGGIDQFKAGTIIPETASGRTVSTYNDWTDVRTISVNGEEIRVGSNLVITDTTYQFTLSEDYNDLLQNIAEGVIY